MSTTDNSGATDDGSPGYPVGPFFKELARRKQRGRDAKITITAKDAGTGVGKTSLAAWLACILDTSEGGFDAEEKGTLFVEEFTELYDIVPAGSVIVLDEAEQIDARRSMKDENIEAAFRWQTRRVREIIGILTLPTLAVLDKRMEHLQDYWIQVHRRGHAKIYKKRIHPIKKKVYYKSLQTLSWPNMDGHPPFEHLTDLKDQFIEGDPTDKWMQRSEHEAALEQTRKETALETRNELLCNLWEHADVTQTELATAADLTSQRVSQIVNSG